MDVETLDQKLALDVEEIQDVVPLGRTTLYAAIGRGELKARKCGRRTLVLVDDLKSYLDGLPTLGGDAA